MGNGGGYEPVKSTNGNQKDSDAVKASPTVMKPDELYSLNLTIAK